MTALCPHCGYDLVRDEPIISGDLEMDPRGHLVWQGRRTRLSKSQHAILWAVLKAQGRIVSVSLLAERYGYEGDDTYSVVTSHMSTLRKRLPGLPIVNVYGHGYRWAA